MPCASFKYFQRFLVLDIIWGWDCGVKVEERNDELCILRVDLLACN